MGLAESQNGHEAKTFDVLVVGAGVSGINAAYRLQSQLPEATFTILEGRGDIGGTWDLFRYPGIRSDSDLFTYGFQWEPWPYETPIAEGPLIKQYMKDCVTKYDLGRYINFHHRVLTADRTRESEQWHITAEHEGKIKEYRATWLILGTGYYDYEKTLETVIPGLENFKGKVIYPQHWPEDYDYSGKKMAVIGSGATAVTLIPALAKTAAAVTMIQRSPTYIASKRNGSPATSWLMKIMPKTWARTWLRIKSMWGIYLVVLYAHYFPQSAQELMIGQMSAQLPARIPARPHFSPRYTPWQQRLCLAPDGDFFRTLRETDTTHVVTGLIDAVDENGVRMQNGSNVDFVEADVIVAATGLLMKMGGDVKVTVNGEGVDWAGRLLWHGSMVQDVPNLMFMVGYIDSSWTLGADATAHILTRLFKYMKSKGVSTAVPRVPPEGTNGYQRFWQLTSTYSNRAEHRLPKYGNTGPWRPKTSPPWDWVHGKWGDITTGLHFSP